MIKERQELQKYDKIQATKKKKKSQAPVKW